MEWKNRKGKNKKVVIVDSGVNQSHEELRKYKFVVLTF